MNATSILIRAIGESEWTMISSVRLMWMIEAVLKAELKAGRFDFTKLSNKPQVVTDMDLFETVPPVPKNAVEAKKQGFCGKKILAGKGVRRAPVGIGSTCALWFGASGEPRIGPLIATQQAVQQVRRTLGRVRAGQRR
jgi:hypothetical protein